MCLFSFCFCSTNTVYSQVSQFSKQGTWKILDYMSRIISGRALKRKLQIRSFHLLFFFLSPEQKSELLFIALLALLKERMALLLLHSQKASDSHENPKRQFPTLHFQLTPADNIIMLKSNTKTFLCVFFSQVYGCSRQCIPLSLFGKVSMFFS